MQAVGLLHLALPSKPINGNKENYRSKEVFYKATCISSGS